MANNSKDIELVIRTTDLSSKPIDEIGNAVVKLEKAMSDLGPAAQRGEVKLGELQRVAVKLEQALKGLAANQAVIERFHELSNSIASGKEELTRYAARVDEARKALADAVKPTKELRASLKGAEADYARQEKELGKLSQQLENLGEKATKAGINLKDISSAQSAIDATLSRTTAAYQRVNTEIDEYDANLRAAAATAKEAAAQQQRAAEQAANAQALAAYRAAQDNKAQQGAAAFERDRQEITRLNAEAVKLRQSAEYVQFWTDSLNNAEKAVADRAAFQKLGQDAEDSARGFRRARVEIDQLAQANKKAGASVREILNPEAELIRTLNGMESAVARSVAAHKEFETQMRRTGRATVDINSELSQLGNVQSNAAGLAALIDRFRNTRAAAADAAIEMRQARTEVLQYANAVKTADAPNKELAESLALAQQRLAAAEARYQSFAAAAQKLRGDVAAAGVNMRDLAGEMSRVENVARGATAATNTLAGAVERTGSAAGKGATGFNLFTQGGRTTLSLAQRLRGELLALTATYVGLYGAISGVGSVLQAVETQSGIEAKLAVAFGKEGVGGAIAYLNEQAARLGIEFPKAAADFSDIAIAAKAAGFTLDETKFVFESFAEAGKVMRLSPDNLSGVFKALNQIMSKSKVQAEELRGQLGDRLSGAFNTLAESMGITAAQLDKMIEAGAVPDDFLLLFAQRYRDLVSGELPAATKTAASEIARFKNEVFRLQLALADSGFLDAFTKAVARLTAYFQSADGAKFAEALGAGLTKLANLFIVLIDNIETVKNVLLAVGGVWAISFGANAARSIAETGAKVFQLSALIQAEGLKMSTAMSAVGPALAAGFVGFSLGAWLNDQVPEVRQFGVALVTGFAELWTKIKFGVEIFAKELGGSIDDALNSAYNIVVYHLKQILTLTAGFAQKLGFDDLATSLVNKAASLSEKRVDGLGARTKQLRAQLEQELQAIRDIGQEMFDEAGKKKSTTAPGAAPVTSTGTQTGADQAKLDALRKQAQDSANAASKKEQQAAESAAKKRIALAEQVADELARIEQGISERGAETLEQRLAVIDTQYRELINKIKELGGSEGASAQAKLEELIVLRKIEETQKYNDEQRKKRIDEIKDAEQAVNDRVQVRDAMIAAENAKRRAGLLTEEQARLNIAKITQDMNPSIAQAANDTIAMIDAIKDPAVQAALAAVRANMEAVAANTVEIPERLIQTEQVLGQWADGLVNVADAAAKAVAEGEGLSGAFRAAGQAFRQFASDFLRQIAQMILQQIILNALRSNPYTAAFAEGVSSSTAATPQVRHSGGVISHGSGRTRRVDAAWFANAPRYHSGGMVGLRSDEVPAILQTGEEVLSRNDPRNAKNGAGSRGATNVKIVNAIDAGSFISEGLNDPAGGEALLNFIRANRSALTG